MKYHIYYKNKTINNTCVYIKRNIGNPYEYRWIDVKYLNGEYFKNYTKASLNIFKAKQVINNEKILDKKLNKQYTFEYWVEEVKD